MISDVRFPNEVTMVRALGGQVWRIDRSDWTVEQRGDLHPSEAQIFDLEVDGAIRNRFGSAAAFMLEIFTRFDLGSYTPPAVMPPPANDRETAEQILTHFRGGNKPVPHA